jgi:glycogen debranching enzyme
MSTMEQENSSEVYQQAIDLLYRCSSADGFLASPTENTNYRRIWSRDGTILGLAALIADDTQLIRTFRETLLTLAKFQGPHGEIPSNVEPVSGRVSYGGTTGRVDADLWFVIGCCEYWLATEDTEFLRQVIPAIEKVRFLLGAWEFNNRGLLYVPQTGDWADEYLHSGYVLYDQLLYYQAQRAINLIHEHVHGTTDHGLKEKYTRLKHLIQANFWLDPSSPQTDDVYHKNLYEKGIRAEPNNTNSYWMPFFSPTGYGYRFDAFANVLASLFDMSDEEKLDKVDTHIASIVSDKLKLLPAFHPVILPMDTDWKELQMTFSFTFKNHPYEFQNGGLWAMITGFYVADLCQRGQFELAQQYTYGIDDANAKEYQGHAPGFAEYLHGMSLEPGGTVLQGWSAAASIIARQSLLGKRLFRINV